MDDKTKSIVAHLTLVGWIIALVMNQSDKGPNTSYYLRQMLGLVVLSLVAWLLGMTPVPFLSLIVYILIAVLWVLSLLGALSGQQKPLPVVGEMFQQWFKSIS
ncbi:MAG TPA: hypothetical protein VFG10_09610 [Saprospiraceae bacterium]|nr:hypothetical protein [Saprospiraceae bacterium]